MSDQGVDTTLLTIRDVAERLEVSTRTVERLDLPTIYLGTRTRRYIWSDVLATLRGRAV